MLLVLFIIQFFIYEYVNLFRYYSPFTKYYINYKNCIDIVILAYYNFFVSHKQEDYIMKKKKLFSILLFFILLFTALSVFAGSSSFSEPLSSGYWSGSLSVGNLVVTAEKNLDPIPPTINLSAGVSGTVWFVDYYGNEYSSNYSEHQDYVDGVAAVLILPSGARTFTRADSYHYGYINGSCDNNYLSASN